MSVACIHSGVVYVHEHYSKDAAAHANGDFTRQLGDTREARKDTCPKRCYRCDVDLWDALLPARMRLLRNIGAVLCFVAASANDVTHSPFGELYLLQPVVVSSDTSNGKFIST